MEENEEYQGKLGELAGEAKDRRKSEEEHLWGDQAQAPVNLLEWARDRRKRFEGYSLSLGNDRPPPYLARSIKRPPSRKESRLALCGMEQKTYTLKKCGSNGRTSF